MRSLPEYVVEKEKQEEIDVGQLSILVEHAEHASRKKTYPHLELDLKLVDVVGAAVQILEFNLMWNNKHRKDN